ncbi:MAG TPA: ribbon-helix-helix protein, CopG family, partial [Burkholderiales bacterium]
MASMENLSFKVPRVLRKRLAAEARRRGVSQSTIVREALEDALDRWRKSGDLTCADMAGGLIGSFRGRRDSSTNQRYLDEAIVADATRTSRRESEIK